MRPARRPISGEEHDAGPARIAIRTAASLHLGCFPRSVELYCCEGLVRAGSLGAVPPHKLGGRPRATPIGSKLESASSFSGRAPGRRFCSAALRPISAPSGSRRGRGCRCCSGPRPCQWTVPSWASSTKSRTCAGCGGSPFSGWAMSRSAPPWEVLADLPVVAVDVGGEDVRHRLVERARLALVLEVGRAVGDRVRELVGGDVEARGVAVAELHLVSVPVRCASAAGVLAEADEAISSAPWSFGRRSRGRNVSA